MNISNIKVGIIGIGFVGSAMLNSFINKGLKIIAYDKYKTYNTFEEVTTCDIIFMALPTIYDEKLEQYDLSAIEENLQLLKKHSCSGIIVNKSTVSPKTTQDLATKYELNLVHNPEFLTAKTAFFDFHNQMHIVVGITNNCDLNKYENLINFYSQYYPNAQISECTALESECMKIFCNSFYAAKIQFFNELYLLCDKIGANYNNIKNLMLGNNWINPMHTVVPGPDNKLSYGGLCFPKDTCALRSFMKQYDSSCMVLNAVIEERNLMRDDYDNVAKKID